MDKVFLSGKVQNDSEQPDVAVNYKYKRSAYIMSELEIILEKINEMDKKFDGKFDKIDGKFDEMDKKFNEMDKKFNEMDKKFEHLEKKVDGVEFILENEVNKNIMLVAEGHADLSRNLKELTTSNNDFELLKIRVNILESNVEKLQRKIS